MGGYIASSAALENGLFEVIDTDLNADDVTAQGKDNASVTVLPKNCLLYTSSVPVLLVKQNGKLRLTSVRRPIDRKYI